MLDSILRAAPWAILFAVPIALFGVLCRINRMDWWRSPRPVVLSYLIIAIGWGCVLFGTMDYLAHSPPMWWPVFLLLGLMLLAVGNAALFLADRRKHCAACPRSGC